MSVSGIRVASEATVVVACFSAAFAILWYILHRRGLNRDNRRAGYLLFACFLCCGLSQLASVASYAHPHATLLVYAQFALVCAGLVSGVAVWPLLPALATLPTTRDLQDANAALARKERARSALMNRLTDVNRDLERRVAERTSELTAANRRFEAALAGSAISVAQQDRDLRYIWSYNMPGALPGSPEFLPQASAERLDAAKRTALQTGASVRLEICMEIEGSLRWFEERIEPVLEGRETIGVISTAVDVTSRKRHELELTGLLRELTHRSKNLLAVVQGIARQTGRTSNSVDEFNRRFAGRLQALSLTHELLIATSWRHVELRSLVEGLIAHEASDRTEAVRIEGARVLISPELAQSLAIALHEMASNAAAYGSLSVKTGALALTWNVVNEDDRRLLEFCWRETSGPEKPEARQRGFGLSFVETLLPRALQGRSSLEFDDAGLLWRLSFPI